MNYASHAQHGHRLTPIDRRTGPRLLTGVLAASDHPGTWHLPAPEQGRRGSPAPRDCGRGLYWGTSANVLRMRVLASRFSYAVVPLRRAPPHHVTVLARYVGQRGVATIFPAMSLTWTVAACGRCRDVG